MDTVRGAISPISPPYNKTARAHVHEQKSPVKKKEGKGNRDSVHSAFLSRGCEKIPPHNFSKYFLIKALRIKMKLNAPTSTSYKM